MSFPCDVEADCAMESPAENPGNDKRHLHSLQFDPKYRNLPGGGSHDDRTDSGIDSLRSVDSCHSFDSSGRENSLASISEHTTSHISQQLNSIHISPERRRTEEIRTDTRQALGTTLEEGEEEEDEACVECSYVSTTTNSFGEDRATTTTPQDTHQLQPGSGYLTDDAFDQDQEGDTPLHLAIIHKKVNVVFTFIYYAEDPELLNIRNCLMQTPLHLAVLTKQPLICRVLLLAGAQVDSVDRNGDTPLHMACRMVDDGCMRALTERITPLELQEGWTHRKEIAVRSLPQNLELRNFEGLTCVHVAAFYNGLEHLRYLVQLGANIDALDGKSGRTALHHAVEMGKLQLTHHLIQSLNADVDALTFDLCTPLHLAAGRGLKTIVMLLMENRADADITNFEGEKPGDLSKDSQIMMYIQNAGPSDDMMFTDIKIQGQ